MKLTEENKLQFLLWLADNHALELRQHSKQNKAKPTDGTKNWWERRELPAPFETCAILSTSLISDKLDEWSKLPAGASVGVLTGDCGSKKAMTAFIRAKVCTDAARDKGPDKHTPSGPVSEYFLIVPGGVDAFLEAVRSAVAGERRPAKRSPLIPLSQAAAASAASAANSRSVVRRPAPKRRFSLASENIPPVPLFVGSSVPPKRALPACPVSPSSWGMALDALPPKKRYLAASRAQQACSPATSFRSSCPSDPGSVCQI